MLMKNTLRKIKKSTGRYFSILFIILVGVGFLSGLRATSANIRYTLSNYYTDQNLMDIRVISAIGFSENEINEIKGIQEIKSVYKSNTIDVLDENGLSIRVHSNLEQVNTPILVEGKLPNKDNEVLADHRNYRVGDKIVIETDVTNILSTHTFVVSGTIESPLYVLDEYGNTTIGDGTLSSFIFVQDEVFTMPDSTELYIKINNPKNVLFYEQEYNHLVKAVMTKIELLQENTDTTWFVADRRNQSGYQDLKNATDMIDQVAAVLPLFFILIVVLMTSNTMARMILEERGEIGTLISIGYSPHSVTFTYLAYVLSATIIGSVIGFYIGNLVIPNIIYQTFQKFIVPDLDSYFVYTDLLVLCIAAAGLMVFVTVFFCNYELRQIPAKLLRPVPPKKGKRLLLERVKWIWNGLNFTWKVTIRNMFRYKQRVLMTVIGVAGCSALLVTGFGLKDSVSRVVNEQFSQYFQYEGMITLSAEINAKEDLSVEEKLKDMLKTPLLVHQSFTTVSLGSNEGEAYFIIPENENEFLNYYHLIDVLTKEQINLPVNGIYITQRLAELLMAKEGSLVTLEGPDHKKYEAKVVKIVENYIGNYIYLTKGAYQDIVKENVAFNLLVTDLATTDKKELTRLVMEEDQLLNITLTSETIRLLDQGMASLDGVIVLIVVVAILLSIIVLYNLTSINLSERKREIATLKVLGFTEKESNQYIYRETFFLSFMSTLLGLGLGVIMHQFVITTISGTNVMYLSRIDAVSYLWAVLILLIVILFMMVVTQVKIKTIPMMDSLKSVE